MAISSARRHTQTIIGNITSAITFLVGAALTASGYGTAAGVGLMLGGVTAEATTIVNQVTQGMQIFDYGTKNSIPANNNLFLYDEVILRKTSKKIADASILTSGAWLKENGRPLKANMLMKDILGYTELAKASYAVSTPEEEKELNEILMTGAHFPETVGW